MRALGYVGDGDLPTLSTADRDLLRQARDQVGDLPQIDLVRGSLAVPVGSGD